MTKEFIYRNISSLETFAVNCTGIKKINEIVIQDEAKGTNKKKNFFIQFVNDTGYTEICEMENEVVVINYKETLDKENKVVSSSETKKIPKNNFYKEFKK